MLFHERSSLADLWNRRAGVRVEKVIFGQDALSGSRGRVFIPKAKSIGGLRKS